MIKLSSFANQLIRPMASLSSVTAIDLGQISAANVVFSSEEQHQICPLVKKRSYAPLIGAIHPHQYSRLIHSPVDFCQKSRLSTLCSYPSGGSSNGSNPLTLYRPRHFSTSSIGRAPSIASLFLDTIKFIQSIEDPKQRKFAWSIFTLALLGIASGFIFLSKKLCEESKKLDIKTSPPDLKKLPQEIVDLQTFVEEFNDIAHNNPTDISDKLDKAFEEIQKWGIRGKLYPLDIDNVDRIIVMRALLELIGCENSMIQMAALKSLIQLLKAPINTLELIGPLCSLIEFRLWKILDSAEIEKPTPIMEALVTAYRLTLQRIYDHCVGGRRSLNSKVEIERRADEIGLKLERNIEFHYQSKVAQSIASNLPIVDQAMTNTLQSLDEIVKIFEDAGNVAGPLLKQEVVSLEFIKDLIGLLKGNPEYYGRAELAYKRLREAYQGHPLDFISLKVDHGNLEKSLESINKSLDLFREKQNKVGFSQSDWIHLYGLSEMLCRLADSNAENKLRMRALESLTSLINDRTPEQILFKIATFLFSVRNDPLHSIKAQEQIEILEPIFLSKGKINSNWDWIKANADSIEKLERQLKLKTEFKPASGSKIEREFSRPVFQNQLVIQQRPVFSSVFNVFQQFPPNDKTIKQVISGRDGIGKTTFVTDFIRKFGKIYSEIYWIDVHSFDLEIEQLAESFKIDSQGDARIKAVKNYLEQHPGWLIVFDNADQLDASERKKIENILPQFGGHVLMTVEVPGNDWQDFEIHKLDLIERDEAVYLLMKLIKDTNKANAGLIADRLGNLPLALFQAVGWMKDGDKVFEDFIAVFDEKKETLKDLPLSDENRSIVLAWATNFDAVKNIDLNAASLISFLSFIYSQEIRMDLIRSWKEHFAPHLGEGNLSDALTLLSKRMMIEKPSRRGSGTHPNVYQFYSLNQECMRRILSQEEWIKYVEQAIVILTDLTGFKNFNPVRQVTHEAFEQMRPHLEALIKHIDHKHTETLSRMNKFDESMLVQLQYLANTVGWYHLYIGKNFELAERCFDFVRIIASILYAKGNGPRGHLYQAWYHYLEAMLLLKKPVERNLSQQKKRQAIEMLELAESEFRQLDEKAFQNHYLESNNEKWNKAYAIAISRFELLVAKGYPSDKPEELTQLMEEYETLISQFESAAAQSWDNLRGSGEKWEKEKRERRDQNKDSEVNTFRFDIPRCMREQAKIYAKQGHNLEKQGHDLEAYNLRHKVCDLLYKSIKEQKKLYQATLDADFYTTPAVAVNCLDLAEIYFDMKDYLNAIKYGEKAYRVNLKIYGDKQHPYVKRIHLFIEKCRDANRAS